MKKIKKQLLLFILSSLILIFLIILDWPDGKLRVIFCDVGQGDAILVTKDFKQILIDSGPNSSVATCLERHLPFWDREIDIAIATHADKDHIGGFETILNEFFVDEMIITEFGKKTDVFLTFRELLLREKELGMKLNLLDDNQSIKVADNFVIDNLLTRVEGAPMGLYNSENTETQLWDQIDAQSRWLDSQSLDHNAMSIVTILHFGNTSFLFTGDLEENGEQALINNGLIGDVDVLKVGHHGSKTSTSQQLLDASLPELSVISVGKSNSYRHPSPQVLVKLEQFGTKVLRTDQLGDVVIVSDGQSYWVE
jgi:competence protein ComEC